MIEFEEIHIDSEAFRIKAYQAGFSVQRHIRDWVDDLSQEVERKAKEFAPIGAAPPVGSSRNPGELKRHGVIRIPAHHFQATPGDGGMPGEIVTEFPSYGGGFTVRGGNPANTGQFSRVELFQPPGHIFTGFGDNFSSYTASVQLNPGIPHSKWVHEGTGLYGPFHSPIVPTVKQHLVFWYRGRKWLKRSVRGQRPQPFLTEAFEYVNNVYAPAKLSELRAEIYSDL